MNVLLLCLAISAPIPAARPEKPWNEGDECFVVLNNNDYFVLEGRLTWTKDGKPHRVSYWDTVEQSRCFRFVGENVDEAQVFRYYTKACSAALEVARKDNEEWRKRVQPPSSD